MPHYYTEKAEDYWNREYLDYSKNPLNISKQGDSTLLTDSHILKMINSWNNIGQVTKGGNG